MSGPESEIVRAVAKVVALLLAAAVGGAVGLGVAGPVAADAAYLGSPERGKLIYETRCIGCHAESVHSRNPRSATSCDEVRAAVLRWSRQTGLRWSDEEIEDVTLHLNERYYCFPVRDGRCAKALAVGWAGVAADQAARVTASGSPRPTTR